MIIGDLVMHRKIYKGDTAHIDQVGVIVEIMHAGARNPDYRTPTSVCVFYGMKVKDGTAMKQEVWFHKSELELLNE
jgi:hypothetical protein